MRLALALTAVLLMFSPVWADSGRAADPRAGDAEYERMQRLFGDIRDILDQTSRERGKVLDGEGGGFISRQFGTDSKTRVERLLGDAFDVITDAPVSDIRNDIARARENIAELTNEIANLREKRLSAPDKGGLLGLKADKESIDGDIAAAEQSVRENEALISEKKHAFRQAMAATGVELSPQEADMLLDSVTGGDLVDIATAFQAAQGLSDQLKTLMDASGEDLTHAKRYYAMHTALIALLAHAQSEFIAKVDNDYLPKLGVIEKDIHTTRHETRRLLGGKVTKQQKRALEGNLRSQEVALDAARLYRQHLTEQRAEIAMALAQTTQELRVADNTLRTVDASFQLKELMDSATMDFDALRNLQSPGIERIFRNEDLRREFKALSERLAPTS